MNFIDQLSRNSFQFFLFISLIVFSIKIDAQSSKQCFDRVGEKVGEENSYYCRVSKGGDSYESFYTSNDQMFFKGRLVEANGEIKYKGKCTWFYKNGNKKSVRNYNENGDLEGESLHYFKSGKLSKKEEYKKGKLKDSKYVEYDENGGQNIVFIEEFNNNNNDWSLYSSEKGKASIEGGNLILESFNDIGISRFLDIYTSSKNIAIEASFTMEDLKSTNKVGIVFGFKDWDNYNFFLVSEGSFYVGSVYEGVEAIEADGMYTGDLKMESSNVLKIISLGGSDIFSINGSINYKTDKFRTYGSNKGVILGGKGKVSFDRFEFKEMNLRGDDVTYDEDDLDVKSSASGFFIDKSGYILTNHHVIEDAAQIVVEIVTNGTPKDYNAVLIQQDKVNDIAIIKIDDADFKPLKGLSYSVVKSSVNVGASAFTIGYPMALGGMGKDAKYTEGSISAKTGYNGAINSYQISVPVQPGNSGAPLFNSKGELIGIINSKITNADNVSYAIKANYIASLADVVSPSITLPSVNKVKNLSLEEKIKVLKKCVVLIKIK